MKGKTMTHSHSPASVHNAHTGDVVCHTASQTKAGLPSRRRVYPRRVMMAAWESMGWTRTDGGRTFALCQTTGAWLPLNADATADERRVGAVIDASHTHAQASGGAYCGCVMLPESRAVNVARGDAEWDGGNVDWTAYAAAFRAAWLTDPETPSIRIRKAL